MHGISLFGTNTDFLILGAFGYEIIATSFHMEFPRRQTMKYPQLLIASLLLIAFTASAQAKPGPVNNPPIKVQEQNLDGNGWIKVHEQGVVGAEITNASDQNGVIPLVVDVNDMAGKQPVAWTCGNPVPDDSYVTGCLTNGEPWVVPEGKRLIIETVSVNLSIDSSIPAWVDISTNVDGNEATSWIPMQSAGTNAESQDVYVSLNNIKLYADHDDSSPIIRVRKESNTVGGYVEASISGYLVDK